MKWIKAVIETSPSGVEPITGLLLNVGVSGTQIEDEKEMQRFLSANPGQWDYIDEELLARQNDTTQVIFYVPEDPFGADTLLAVKDGLSRLSPEFGRPVLQTWGVDDQDWIDNWKKYYKPFPVGQSFIIKPVWEAYDNRENKLVLQIEPGHVFGTGLHQSTQLCLEQLETHVNPQTNLLDLGCGSGILSIAGLLLGAKKALALDLEPNAEEIAYQNAALNNIGRDIYTVLTGDILHDEALRARVKQERYSLITANIVADVIIGLVGFATDVLSPGGLFIASGIIREREQEVADYYKEKGFTHVTTSCRDGWVCMVWKGAYA